jgi:hypothetical protein
VVENESFGKEEVIYICPQLSSRPGIEINRQKTRHLSDHGGSDKR